MKKMICMLMAVALLLGLCACGQVSVELSETAIRVSANTEGRGNIAYTEGKAAPEIDREYPYQSVQIGLDESETYTFLAWPNDGASFVKWTKNGEDFSADPQITVLLDESADFIAVFEDDPDWQNPVMNFVGEYQCGRAHALVECLGRDGAMITVEWGGSAWETARWFITGSLDTETLSLSYTGSTKSNLVYDENGEVKSEEIVYEDGTGTVTFHDDGTFTWHEDQSESGEDMVFAWLDAQSGMVGMANPWRDVTEEEAKALCPNSFSAPEGAENVYWSVMESGERPLVQLFFDLNGYSFTAREQATGDEAADLSGMYYTWTAEREEQLKNWADGAMTVHLFRFAGESETADCAVWYDAEAGVSYSLGVTAEDLDGFDLAAVADALHE